MKKITASVFLQRFLKSAKSANSIVFSEHNGHPGSKLGNLKRPPLNSLGYVNFRVGFSFSEKRERNPNTSI